MKQKKLVAFALLLAGATGSVCAATITNPDGTFDFGGFDWASSGSVLISGYDVTNTSATGSSDPFTLDFQAYAANVQDSGGTNLVLSGLRAGSGTGYEYTVNAHLNETVTCLTDGFNSCGIVQINVVGGTWDVYYQQVGDALAGAAGMSGILNGVSLLSGTFSSGDTLLGTQGATNPGNVTLSGTFRGAVNSTNNTYINPDLGGTEAVSTLQFGANTTAWTRPTNWDGLGALAADTNSTFVGQADANQAFSVPEPATLALLGLGLMGVGVSQRRRKQA